MGDADSEVRDLRDLAWWICSQPRHESRPVVHSLIVLQAGEKRRENFLEGAAVKVDLHVLRGQRIRDGYHTRKNRRASDRRAAPLELLTEHFEESHLWKHREGKPMSRL